jgi:NAD(P)-dependent dehydrogenase (short-subunit alcohol dehydrogenase family)
MTQAQLQDKQALVTGGGSGIGKATAVKLAAQGATVGVLDVDEDKVMETVREIQEQGGTAVPLVGDISSPEDVEGAVKTFVGEKGQLDVVFANAGINGVWAPVEELAPEEWEETLQTNLTGTFLTIKASVPFMKKEGGSIVITSSVNGTRIFSNAGASAYSSTKAAQVAFGKMLALELAKYRIRVNVICPGSITTNIGQNTETRNVESVKPEVIYPKGEIPLTGGKAGTAEEVADLVLFLSGRESEHISGAEVFIDGAQSLIR